MPSLRIEVQVGQSEVAYNWESAYILLSDYDAQAEQALKQLETGYNRIRASIIAGMKPENKVKDDRPEIEKRGRVVSSGPIKINTIN